MKLVVPSGSAWTAAPWASIGGGAIMTTSLLSAILGFRDRGTNLSAWPHPPYADYARATGCFPLRWRN